MSDHPVVSFSIVSWNVREYLWKCLHSIERFVDTPHEVLVVDNGSSDDTVSMIQREFPDVRIIANHDNPGFAVANNQALRLASGEFVVVLNPDTEFRDNPLPIFIDYLRQHDDCACLGPEVLNSDGSHQQSVRHFPQLSDQAVVLLKLRHLLARTAIMKHYLADPGKLRRQPLAVDQLMGACMIIPRAKLNELGDFDESFPNWFEEVDWCQRAHQAGYAVVYHPGGQIIHHGGQSFGQVVSLKKQRWFTTGLRRYAKKYWSRADQVTLACLMPINLALSAVQTLIIRY